MEGQSATGIVGRERELAAVAEALRDPIVRGVALAGPAGVGKSRLAEAALTIAEESGAMCLTAIATPASHGLTLGALTHLLPPAGELADLHEELRPAQLLRSTQLALREQAGDQPLVLAIDDAHLLDPVSAHLVGQLAANGIAKLVLTVRSGERAPEAVTALWKDGLVRRIDLEVFDQEATSRFAAHLLGGALDAPATRWLHRTSAGNAFYARELVLGARESGALVVAGSTWTMSEHAPTMSPMLSDLVEQRLSGLDADERRALDLIALAEPLGIDLAIQIVGEDALNRLDEHGLLQVVIAGSRVELRPAHPLYGEALRQRPITLRRRTDLLALIRAVQDLGARRRDDRVRLAMWQLAAGEPVDPEVLLRAAVAAQQGVDDLEAIRLATLGLRQRAMSADVTAELRVCAATSLGRLARFEEADAFLALAEDDALDEDRRNRIALRRAFTRLEGADDIDGAVAILRHAQDRSDTDAWRERLALFLATALSDSGRSAAAGELMDARTEVPEEPALAIAWFLAKAAAAAGLARWTEAIEHASAGYEFHLAHPEADSVYYPVSHLWYRFTASHRGGWTERADEDLDRFDADAVSEGRPIAAVVSRILRARMLLDAGRLDDAARWASEAAGLCTTSMQPYLHRWATATHVWAAAARGDLAGATAARDALAAAGPQPVVHGMAAGLGRVEVVMASVTREHAAGHAGTARALLRAEIELAQADGDLATASELLVQECLLVGQRTTGERLRDILDLLDPAAPMTAAYAGLARGLTDGRHEVIAAAADSFARIGQRWTSAQVWRVAADRAAATGQDRAAAAHRRCAADVRAACTGLVTDAVQRPDSLTDREYEIAALVAAGRTSRDVAEQLVVSTRTVDNHLQRIYAKLGVSSRRDLRAVLSPAGEQSRGET
jgi:DNA-binding CsgD family transcriptional regulator